MMELIKKMTKNLSIGSTKYRQRALSRTANKNEVKHQEILDAFSELLQARLQDTSQDLESAPVSLLMSREVSAVSN